MPGTAARAHACDTAAACRLLLQVFEELRSHMFGNPHSANPSSSMTGDKVRARGARARPPPQQHCAASPCCMLLQTMQLVLRCQHTVPPASGKPSRCCCCIMRCILRCCNACVRQVEEVRDLVLRYFNADPAEYQVGARCVVAVLGWEIGRAHV